MDYDRRRRGAHSAVVRAGEIRRVETVSLFHLTSYRGDVVIDVWLWWVRWQYLEKGAVPLARERLSERSRDRVPGTTDSLERSNECGVRRVKEVYSAVVRVRRQRPVLGYPLA